MKKFITLGFSVAILLTLVACQCNTVENVQVEPPTSTEASNVVPAEGAPTPTPPPQSEEKPDQVNTAPATPTKAGIKTDIVPKYGDTSPHGYEGESRPGVGGAAPLPGTEADAKGLSGGYPVCNGPYNPNFDNNPDSIGKMIPSTTKKSWINYNGPTTPIIVADICYIVHAKNATLRDWFKEYGKDQGYVIRNNKIYNCDGGQGINILERSIDKPATTGVNHNMVPRNEL